MNKNFDVVALGELLIDFTMNGFSNQGNFLFEANPGGAPCNVLSMLTNLQKKTAFIGKVGNDFLGKHLKNVVENIGINTDNLILDDNTNTTLAFVHTSKDGDRDFSFYRNPGADMMLNENDIIESVIASSKIFHFGSLSMTHECNRNATKKALNIAKNNDCLISFDPNLREPLWNNLEIAKQQIIYGISQCDILKISDNEVQWLINENNLDLGIQKIKNIKDIPLILLSMGKNGSRAYYKNTCTEVSTFLDVKTIETTGAGDTFCACILNYILEHSLNNLTKQDIIQMLTFANSASSLITTKKGALCVMPSKNDIDSLIQTYKTSVTYKII